MEDELVDEVLSLEAALFPGEFGQVVGGLRVFRIEHLEFDLVALFGRQLLLVVAGHVVVVLAEEVLVILNIVIDIFFDLSTGGALLGSASSGGWHLFVLI